MQHVSILEAIALQTQSERDNLKEGRCLNPGHSRVLGSEASQHLALDFVRALNRHGADE